MESIITQDKAMLDVIALAKTVASSKATVLLQGESGTGKELIASLIHQESTRSAKPFLAINCAAIPDNLLESELFGYEKGSFTGALQQGKQGKFELAHGGTLLLDEIAEMDMKLQAKLLRALQEGDIDRIGSKKSISVDVRIIASTNQMLSEAVARGVFREDLFYRLNVVTMTLPRLKNRLGDIDILTNFFMNKHAEKHARPILELSADARSKLNAHVWPGNVRELENMVERVILTHTDASAPVAASEIEFSSIGKIRQGDRNWSPGKTLDDIERNVIIEALGYHQGNRTHTAKALGISIRTLRNKISDYKTIGIKL